VDGDLAAATGAVSLHSWKVITGHVVSSPMAAGEQRQARRVCHGGRSVLDLACGKCATGPFGQRDIGLICWGLGRYGSASRIGSA